MSQPRPPLRAVLAHEWFHLKKRGRKSFGKLLPAKLRRARYLHRQREKAKELRPMVESRDFNLNPKLIFLHIQKTAGMSFAKLAGNHYPGETSITTNGKFEHDKWVSSKVVGGHFQFICYEAASPGHVYLAVLRDPVERAVSLFRFYTQEEDARELRIKQGYDHSSFRNTLCNSIYEMDFMRNLQCRYLTNRMTFTDALKVLHSRPFIVGTFDQLDDWLNTITREFDWPEKQLPVINRISTEKPTCDDPQVMEMLKRYNREDRKLYEYVRERGVLNSLPADFDRSPFRPKKFPV